MCYYYLIILFDTCHGLWLSLAALLASKDAKSPSIITNNSHLLSGEIKERDC